MMRLVKMEYYYTGVTTYINPDTVETVETEMGKHNSATVIRLISGDVITVKDPLELVVLRLSCGITNPEVTPN